MRFSRIHRAEQERMLRAVAALRHFQADAMGGGTSHDFADRVADVYGRRPGVPIDPQEAVNELGDLSLGLLQLARSLVVQLTEDEASTADQVVDALELRIRDAELVD